MEFLLLWIDDLDDALGALRHLAPQIAGFFLAVALFALTGLALVVAPHTTLAIAGLVLTATLFEFARKRRRTLQKN
jgi:Flp pilus assembly protein TadB